MGVSKAEVGSKPKRKEVKTNGKALVCSPPSPVPRTHMAEEESLLLKLSSDLHRSMGHMGMPAWAGTHTHTNK